MHGLADGLWILDYGLRIIEAHDAGSFPDGDETNDCLK